MLAAIAVQSVLIAEELLGLATRKGLSGELQAVGPGGQRTVANHAAGGGWGAVVPAQLPFVC